jgi:putative hydrolase
MKIRIDTHTHSVASGHAYSTIDELARGARRRGLAGFILTDHGPSLPGGTHLYHFGNLRILPKRIHGVDFYAGVEANIMKLDGSIDMPELVLGRLDFVLAGFHEICFQPGGIVDNTKAMIAAIMNPFVDAISHPGNPVFPIDKREVAKAAAAYGKPLEINNSSFKVRAGSAESCAALADICAEEGALVVCGSDAHYWKDVGNVAVAIRVIEAAGIPKERVVNASLSGFLAFMGGRKAERLEAFEAFRSA